MSPWKRWSQAPQTFWFRRALFQVHLWMGLGLGLYILMISVSGSAIVLRPQMARWFTPSQVGSMEGTALTGAELNARVAAVYADYTVSAVVPSEREGRATYVALLNAKGEETTRFFDQYAGADLGSTYPWQVASVEWLTRLHDELLMGRTGRKWNGAGGIAFLLMTLSGIVIWWQGSRRWHEGLLIRRASTRGFNWQLHSFLGFWSLLMMFIWGLTAVYFAWPGPFDAAMDWFDPDLNDFERPDGWLLWMLDWHFGRFRGLLWANILWIFLGLLPAVMFITGFILWYRRVVKRYASLPGQQRR
jgi:uncharacterized iron-regulated membrane protein